MTGVEILIIVSIVMQVVAIAIALRLVNKTKFKALWVCCIIALALLCVERVMQYNIFQGAEPSDLTRAWVGIVVSLSFSICVVCARLLVFHVERMAHLRQMLENRFMTALLRTEERSRATFSRELHDGLGPLLSSAKMSLSALNRANLKDSERAILMNTSAVIDEAIRSLREISNNLSPHILNDFGLARGIRHFVDRLGTLRDTNVEFITLLKDERYDSNIEVILYRVACELINNSLKHASATHILVTLREERGLLIMEYNDNGIGFNYSDVENNGMGLSNIRSRISSLNGKFELSSSVGRGMSARITVSINGENLHLSPRDIREIKEMEDNTKRRKEKWQRKR
ncbi:MAG: sensor histidine kinase [Alistipes sp.]|nr:sensor histidine kinase [Alistipes sp.]